MATAEKKGLYYTLARIVEYPWEDIRGMVDECIEMLRHHPEYPPEVREEVEKFKKETEGMSLDELQELYSYTFEFSSDYTIDMGYHLYDGFKRANHLLKMKQIYREQGFPYDEVAKGELPDNLVVILKFLDGLTDVEVEKDIKENFLIKALEKLYKNFELTNNECPYRHIIRALLLVIDKDIKMTGDIKKEGHKA